jgi:hypothetical protein
LNRSGKDDFKFFFGGNTILRTEILSALLLVLL